ADQFVGALPEDRVRAFLNQHCPSPADRLVAEGLERLAAGDEDGARQALERALAAAPEHGGAHLGLARLALRRRDLDAVRAHVQRIPPLADEREAGAHLEQAAALVESIAGAGDEAALQARVD